MGLRMRAARPLLTSRCLSRASVTVSRGFSSNGSTFTKSTPKSFLQPRNEMWNGPTSVFSVLSRGYSTIKVKPTELSSIDSASKGLLSSVASVGDYVEEGEVILYWQLIKLPLISWLLPVERLLMLQRSWMKMLNSMMNSSKLILPQNLNQKKKLQKQKNKKLKPQLLLQHQKLHQLDVKQEKQ